MKVDDNLRDAVIEGHGLEGDQIKALDEMLRLSGDSRPEADAWFDRIIDELPEDSPVLKAYIRYMNAKLRSPV